jgi:Phage portal protein, lambda family
MSRPKGSKNKPKIEVLPSGPQASLLDYELTRQSNIRSFLWTFNPNENQALDFAVRRAFLNEVKYMVRNQPIVNRILGLVENHGIGDGLSVSFNTGDTNFDKVANPVLDNYWNNAFCLVNQYDTGYDVQKLLARYMVIYGEFFILLTESENGYPQFQIIEPENISSPDKMEDNAFLQDGCILDSNGKTIGFWAQTDDDKWEKLDAANVIHFKFARAGNSVRGVSPLSSACVSARHLRDLLTLEIGSAKAQSTFAYLVKKRGGSANNDGMFGPPNRRSQQIQGGSAVTQVNPAPIDNAAGINILPNPPAVQVINGGAIKTLDVGEEATALTTQRMSAPFINMVEFLETQICYSIGIDAYMITKANSVTTGEARLNISDFVAWIRQFQNKLTFGALNRLNIYITSKLIKIKILPKCNGNIFNFSIGRPAILTMDRQRENAMDLSDIANGLMSDTEYYDKRGRNWQEVYDERIREWQIKNEKRKAAGIPPLPFTDLEDLEIPKSS